MRDKNQKKKEGRQQSMRKKKKKTAMEKGHTVKKLDLVQQMRMRRLEEMSRAKFD